jgi:methylated-DNA-[protein]-cysteine S-methyltransferase
MKDAGNYLEYMDSPLGELEIRASENELLSVLFTRTKEHEFEKKPLAPNLVTAKVKTQLEEYFNNSLKQFDISLRMNGTSFQTKVWTELCQIPFGKTLSYLALARRLGDEKCIRAAASANGKNPFAIIVPCHRVIGSNGSLVGYAGDLWRKQWLLEHENNRGAQTQMEL